MAVPKDTRERYEKLKASINRYRRLFHVYDKEEISEEAKSRVAHQELKQAPLSTRVSEITPKKPLLHLPLREIWRYRDLIALTVWRERDTAGAA